MTDLAIGGDTGAAIAAEPGLFAYKIRLGAMPAGPKTSIAPAGEMT